MPGHRCGEGLVLQLLEHAQHLVVRERDVLRRRLPEAQQLLVAFLDDVDDQVSLAPVEDPQRSVGAAHVGEVELLLHRGARVLPERSVAHSVGLSDWNRDDLLDLGARNVVVAEDLDSGPGPGLLVGRDGDREHEKSCGERGWTS